MHCGSVRNDLFYCETFKNDIIISSSQNNYFKQSFSSQSVPSCEAETFSIVHCPYEQDASFSFSL